MSTDSNTEAEHAVTIFYLTRIFTFLAIVIFSGMIDRIVLSFGIRESQAFAYFMTMSSYALLAFAAVFSTFSSRIFFRSALLWLPALSFFALSLLWTSNVQGTILKITSFYSLFLSVALFCSSRAYDDFLKGIFLLGICTGLGSLIGFILFPDTVYFFEHRMFVGIYAHKGPLADAAVISALVAAYYLSKKRSIITSVVFLACAWAIYMSATWSAVFGVVFALFVLIRPNFGKLFLLLAHAFAICLPVALGTFDTSWIVEILGRDVTLSGRTHLWEFVFRNMEGTWLLGSGFQNVGSSAGWSADLNVVFMRDVNEIANHTHNFWIESLYMGGFILVGVMIIYTILIPMIFYDYNNKHHVILMALVVYLAFSAALKLPFYSNSLPSVIYLIAITVFATHQRYVVVSTPNLESRLP